MNRRALVSLGSNLGDRRANLRRALALLEREPSLRLIAVSALLRTAPRGKCAAGGWFLNAAALLETELGIGELGRLLARLENRLGRRADRRRRDHARRLDLDLLLLGRLCGTENGYRVPHPRLTERPFILAPAAEIAPSMLVPATGRTIARHLRDFTH
jgi:2-amino-4-hydroxy-6-hydroxymethyldihydropteridine diphosphokinase